MEKIVRMDNQSGLVLEGGGMRGVFTCGVLDNCYRKQDAQTGTDLGDIRWGTSY